MRFILAACLALVATSAFAKDTTITLNDDEQKALLALMDAGVKSAGLNGVPAAARVLGKLQDANKPPMTPPSSPKPPEK